MLNHYQILGVTRYSSPAEIKSAYRAMCKRYHPDRNEGVVEAEVMFKKVQDAYNVLSVSEKRKKYDRKLYHFNLDKKRTTFLEGEKAFSLGDFELPIFPVAYKKKAVSGDRQFLSYLVETRFHQSAGFDIRFKTYDRREFELKPNFFFKKGLRRYLTRVVGTIQDNIIELKYEANIYAVMGIFLQIILFFAMARSLIGYGYKFLAIVLFLIFTMAIYFAFYALITAEIKSVKAKVEEVLQ